MNSSAVFVVSAVLSGLYELPFQPDANAPGRTADSFPYTVGWGDLSAADTCNNSASCTHFYAAAGNYTISLTGAAIVGFTTRDALVLTGHCTDRTLANGSPWYDSDGPDYHCAWYQAEFGCPTAADYANAGMIATEACCTCGGGILERDLSVPVLTLVQSWGPVRLHTSAGAHFAGSLLTSAPPPLPASSGLRSLVRLLDGLRSLDAAALDVSALDTSAITNLTDLAAGAPQLGLVGLGGWNTSAVVDATRAFARYLGPLAGVALWDVGALEYATDMFRGAPSFDEDLSGWRPRRLRTFDRLFALASAFRGRGLGGWSSENLANASQACGPAFYGTRCTPPYCPRPAWCYNASVFEAQLNVAQRKSAKQLCVLPTTDHNPLRVNYGDGQGWVACNQSDAAAGEVRCICRPALNTRYAATGVYTLLIEGRLDGLLTMVHRGSEHTLKFQAIYAWGNVSLASPPAYVKDGTLLSGFLFAARAPYWATASRALTDLFYLAPTNGTRALERVTRADYLLYNAGKLVGDLSDWRVAFNGSASYALAYANRFNQDLSAWPLSNVTDTSFMFLGAGDFNQPLDSWGVSTWSMQSMFEGALKFNQPLSGWNQRGTLTTIRDMLNGAVAFNQPLRSWNVSALAAGADGMGLAAPFSGCCSFSQNLSAWSRPTTVSECQSVASNSRLTYELLPAACRAFSVENYTTWAYARACAV